eukprot:4487393-Pleurochrysis_carterae.AAC.1
MAKAAYMSASLYLARSAWPRGQAERYIKEYRIYLPARAGANLSVQAPPSAAARAPTCPVGS